MTSLDTTLSSIPRRATRSQRQLGLVGSLAGVFLALKPTSRGSPEVPNWLRRDVGLPPVGPETDFWSLR